MITSNRNVIDYIAKLPVIMITLQLLYDYFAFFTKQNMKLVKNCCKLYSDRYQQKIRE